MMKMEKAMSIINSLPEPRGFMVDFEWLEEGMLRSDHFPDKHAKEPLIEEEKIAWSFAERFAKKMKGQVVNVYVVKQDFTPVTGYKEKMIVNR